MKARFSLKYFVNDCSSSLTVILQSRQTLFCSPSFYVVSSPGSVDLLESPGILVQLWLLHEPVSAFLEQFPHYQSPIDLQSFTRYLRLKLVFMWSSTLREKFNFCFSRVFASFKHVFILARRLGTKLSFYEV